MANFPISAGHPDYSGKTIPTLWARKLLERFYDASVVPSISQTDYEGEISQFGDKVTINKPPIMTITPYTMGKALVYDTPGTVTVDLVIDQGNSWSFILDSVADRQNFTNMIPVWTTAASETMKVVVDTEILAFMVGKAQAANQGATAGTQSGNINLGTGAAPITLTKATVIDYIVDMGLVMDEANVPETGRKLVIPAWVSAMIKKSDLKDASISGDSTSLVRNGRLGTIDRFELFASNHVPKTGAVSSIFAIHPSALTFASQLVENDTMPSPTTFGTLVRGLQVYGRQVVLPEALVEGKITK